MEEARAGKLRAPVVAIYSGETDEAEPFAQALAAAGVLQETVIYDGVPAGFFDAGEPEDACADAWRVVLRFMGIASAR